MSAARGVVQTTFKKLAAKKSGARKTAAKKTARKDITPLETLERSRDDASSRMPVEWQSPEWTR